MHNVACRPTIKWYSRSVLSAKLPSRRFREWLCDGHSMTRRMRRIHQHVSIDVISHKHNLPTLEEAVALKIKPTNLCSIREIVMWCDGQPWLYARTVMPFSALVGNMARLRYLGTRPLGQFLFQNSAIARSQFQFTAITPEDEIFHKAVPIGWTAQKLWARRSSFTIRQHAILLTEIFLPDMEAYLCRSNPYHRKSVPTIA